MLSKVASLVALAVMLPSGASFSPLGVGGLAAIGRSSDGRATRAVPARRPHTPAPLYVFDFFRDRAKEGFEQLGNIATKSKQVL